MVEKAFSLNATDQGHPWTVSDLLHELRRQRTAARACGENKTCKFWLEPPGLARNQGFGARELNLIRRLVLAHHATIVEAWHEHCG
jgi:hypothetical protein